MMPDPTQPLTPTGAAATPSEKSAAPPEKAARAAAPPPAEPGAALRPQPQAAAAAPAPADADPSGAAPSLFAPMTDGTLTYETACARIEEIIRRLDSGDAGLRETLELCQEGRRLVEYCAGELEAVGRGLEELRLDELVARLETGRTAAA
jgi:exodeoxyribonuclease VII small subunit